MNSCTVTKRVHRKGWHISWNKNYKSDNSQNSETVDHVDTDAMNAELGDANVAHNSTALERKNSEETKGEFKTENLSKQVNSVDAIEPTSISETENDAPQDALPNSETKERQDVKEIPLGGSYFFLGFFFAVAIGLAAFGALYFAIGALLIAIAAAVIIAHVFGIKNGKNKKSHIRPSGFYNSILFIVMFSVMLAYLIIFGALGGILGISIAVVFLILIALLLFLVYQTKDLHHEEEQKKKAEKEAAKKQESKEATAEDKKKSRIAGLVVGGIVVALFLTIALLSN